GHKVRNGSIWKNCLCKIYIADWPKCFQSLKTLTTKVSTSKCQKTSTENKPATRNHKKQIIESKVIENSLSDITDLQRKSKTKHKTQNITQKQHQKRCSKTNQRKSAFRELFCPKHVEIETEAAANGGICRPRHALSCKLTTTTTAHCVQFHFTALHFK